MVKSVHPCESWFLMDDLGGPTFGKPPCGCGTWKWEIHPQFLQGIDDNPMDLGVAYFQTHPSWNCWDSLHPRLHPRFYVLACLGTLINLKNWKLQAFSLPPVHSLHISHISSRSHHCLRGEKPRQQPSLKTSLVIQETWFSDDPLTQVPSSHWVTPTQDRSAKGDALPHACRRSCKAEGIQPDTGSLHMKQQCAEVTPIPHMFRSSRLH